MKVLHANKYFFVKGGADRYFLETMDNLTEAGIECVPFSMKHERNQESKFESYFVSNADFSKLKFSVEGFQIASRMFYSSEAKKNVEKLIADEKPDLAHVHNIYHQLSPSILVAFKKAKLPVVMTVEDYKLVCPNYLLYTQDRFCEACKKRKYYQAIHYKCLKDSYMASTLAAFEMWFHKMMGYYERLIDVYITPSKFVKDTLVAWGYPESKITVLPHFGNYDSFPYSFTYNSQDPYIVFSGRLAPEKGVKYLVEALKSMPEVKLKICGEGPEEKALRKTVKDYRMRNVEFMGYLGQQDLSRVIRDGQFVVVPSTFAEPFGLVTTEAFAYGKPVIGARRGGIPEIIEEGKTGFIFETQNVKDLTEKIKKLWNKPELIMDMGKAARRTVEEEYEPGKHIAALKEIYERAMKGKPNNK